MILYLPWCNHQAPIQLDHSFTNWQDNPCKAFIGYLHTPTTEKISEHDRLLLLLLRAPLLGRDGRLLVGRHDCRRDGLLLLLLLLLLLGAGRNVEQGLAGRCAGLLVLWF